MKTLSRILLLILGAGLLAVAFSGCYTKKGAIRRFCQTDSVATVITLHDTVVTDRHSADTVFSALLDTVYLDSGRVHIEYIRTKEKVYLKGTCDPDTVIREIMIPVKVAVQVRKPSLMERVHDARWFLVLAFIMGYALRSYLVFRKNHQTNK